MHTRLPLWLVPVVALNLGASAMAQEAVTADTVLATVNGTEITAGHLLMVRGTLPDQYQALPDETLVDGLLEQLVQQQILADQVGEPGKVVMLALENEKRTLMAATEMQKVIEAAVTPEALQALYDERFTEATPEKEFNASHILVDSEEEAIEIAALLSDGGDFAQLAQERSTGPSGPNGGSLGWFGPGAMVPAFEAAVIALEPGQYSAPVQTQFGWHVVHLVEVRNQSVQPLAEVEGELVAELQQTAIEAHLESLESTVSVEQIDLSTIDASFLSNPTLLDE